MTRSVRWLSALAIGIAVLAAAISVALALLDRDALSRLASQRASLALGRSVEFGRVDLAFWPVGVRLRDVRVAGDPGQPALAEIESVALGLAVAPLLGGRVVLRALELERPRIALPASIGDGLPGFSAIARPGGAPPVAPGAGRPASITIDRFAVRRGELAFGRWKLRDLDAEGRLDPRGSASASFSAAIDGIGELAGGHVQADSLLAHPRVQAQATLRAAQLPALLAALPGAAAAIAQGRLAVAGGRVAGPVSLEIGGSRLRELRAELQASELALRADALEIGGEARAELVLGERFAIDLAGARVDWPGVLHKPAGERLGLSGELGSELSLAAGGRAVLALGRAEVPLALALGGAAPQLDVAGELDLAALPRWLDARPEGLAGVLRSRGLHVSLAPLRIDGALDLDRASLPWQGASVAASGPVRVSGERWTSDALALEIAGQKLSASGAYDAAAHQLEVSVRAQGADAGALLRLAPGAPDVAGRLDASVALRGAPALAELLGSGEFALRDARVRGFSIGAARSGDEQKAQQLSGRFRVAAGGVELDSFSIRGGEGSAGPWRVRDLAGEGTLDAQRALSAQISAAVEGVGRFADARVEVDDLRAAAPRVRAQGVLRDGDLLGLLRLAAPDSAALAVQRGRVEGPVSLELEGGELRAGQAELAASDFELRAGSLQIGGAAQARLVLGQRFAIDLGAARLTVPGVLHKPAGERLALSGALAPLPSSAPLGAALLAVGPSELPVALSADPPRAELAPGVLELAALRGWLDAPPDQVGGTLRFGALRVSFAPLRVEGPIALEAATLPLRGAAVALTGKLQASGVRIAADALSAALGGQTLALAGGYDLSSGQLDGSLRADAVDVEKLLGAFVESPDLSGSLAGRLEWSGPADLGALRGSGEFAIQDGRIRGFSLLREFLAQLGVPVAAAQGEPGSGLARLDEEQFSNLSGRFSLTPGSVDLESLALDYRYASAALRGTVGVPSGALALRGELTLRREVGEQLSGDARVEEQRIPIEGLGGTVARPRLVLGKGDLARLAARYALQGRIGDKLKERIGDEGVDALERVLEGIRRKREPQAAPGDTRN